MAQQLTPAQHAEAVARSILADDAARGAYEAALLDVPAEVAAVLDGLLATERRRSRDWIDADAATVLRVDA
jgi:hypothetical protein